MCVFVCVCVCVCVYKAPILPRICISGAPAPWFKSRDHPVTFIVLDFKSASVLGVNLCIISPLCL